MDWIRWMMNWETKKKEVWFLFKVVVNITVELQYVCVCLDENLIITNQLLLEENKQTNYCRKKSREEKKDDHTDTRDSIDNNKQIRLNS